MMKWFADGSDVDAAFKGKLIDEKSIETRPEKLTSAVLDESIDLSSIKKFFTEDGWVTLQETLKFKKTLDVWPCKICQLPCEDNCIRCDMCLEWLHFKCTKVPARKNGIFCCKFCKTK